MDNARDIGGFNPCPQGDPTVDVGSATDWTVRVAPLPTFRPLTFWAGYRRQRGRTRTSCTRTIWQIPFALEGVVALVAPINPPAIPEIEHIIKFLQQESKRGISKKTAIEQEADELVLPEVPELGI